MRRLTLIVLCLLALTTAACGAGAAPGNNTATITQPIRAEGASDSQTAVLQDIAAQLPNAADAGVAVVFIEGGETRYAFVGNPTFDEDTLFEYGSISKVFTANMLAQMAQEGVVSLDESVNRFLPEDLRGERWEAVTLRGLSTHTSGLPRLPSNMSMIGQLLRGEFDDPYAQYDRDMLYDGLRDVKLQPPGGAAEYSNLGVGWLGTILEQASGQAYPDLVQARLFDPLGMTGATATGWSSEAVAPPLSSGGRPSSNWNMQALAGAGAVRGSIAAAAAFLRASMAACALAAADPVANANCLTQQPSGFTFDDGDEMGLGWIRTPLDDRTLIWHNGGTGGYHSFLGFNPDTQMGIALLGNVAGLDSLDHTGLAFLARE